MLKIASINFLCVVSGYHGYCTPLYPFHLLMIHDHDCQVSCEEPHLPYTSLIILKVRLMSNFVDLYIVSKVLACTILNVFTDKHIIKIVYL